MKARHEFDQERLRDGEMHFEAGRQSLGADTRHILMSQCGTGHDTTGTITIAVPSSRGRGGGGGDGEGVLGGVQSVGHLWGQKGQRMTVSEGCCCCYCYYTIVKIVCYWEVQILGW